MSKAKKITLISVFSIFILLASAVIIWYFGDTYPQFYKVANKEFQISGLDEGFVPQGLCHIDNESIFLYSGYMKDGSASRIYVFDNQAKESLKYITLKVNGEDYVGHAGGIDTDGVSVWISGDGLLLRIFFEDLYLAEHQSQIEVTQTKEMPNGADFLKYDEVQQCLWVGEFHKSGSYDTKESHHIECEGGTNRALTYAYLAGPYAPAEALCGLADSPFMALSTGSLVQGMEMYDGKVILSTSYWLGYSHMKTYEINLHSDWPVDEKFEVDGFEVQLYVADESNLISDMKMPSMSEEIVAVGDRLYIMFENACKKYDAFTREKLKNVYSIPLTQA